MKERILLTKTPYIDDVHVNSSETCQICGGVSTMSLWRWLHDDELKFPPPVKINGRNYWKLAELRAWLAGRAAA